MTVDFLEDSPPCLSGWCRAMTFYNYVFLGAIWLSQKCAQHSLPAARDVLAITPCRLRLGLSQIIETSIIAPVFTLFDCP